MNAIPPSAQMSIRASDERTDTISATFRARDSSAADTFETPMQRILPSR